MIEISSPSPATRRRAAQRRRPEARSCRASAPQPADEQREAHHGDGGAGTPKLRILPATTSRGHRRYPEQLDHAARPVAHDRERDQRHGHVLEDQGEDGRPKKPTTVGTVGPVTAGLVGLDPRAGSGSRRGGLGRGLLPLGRTAMISRFTALAQVSAISPAYAAAGSATSMRTSMSTARRLELRPRVPGATVTTSTSPLSSAAWAGPRRARRRRSRGSAGHGLAGLGVGRQA
jgi:hypothetical protein